MRENIVCNQHCGIYISSVKIHWVAGREPKKVMLRIDQLHLYWDCFLNLILIKNICLYLKYLVEKLVYIIDCGNRMFSFFLFQQV